MGTEMIAKATDSFERKQRRCLDLLDEPTLFTGTPQLSIAVVATPNKATSVKNAPRAVRGALMIASDYAQGRVRLPSSRTLG